MSNYINLLFYTPLGPLGPGRSGPNGPGGPISQKFTLNIIYNPILPDVTREQVEHNLI